MNKNAENVGEMTSKRKGQYGEYNSIFVMTVRGVFRTKSGRNRSGNSCGRGLHKRTGAMYHSHENTDYRSKPYNRDLMTMRVSYA